MIFNKFATRCLSLIWIALAPACFAQLAPTSNSVAPAELPSPEGGSIAGTAAANALKGRLVQDVRVTGNQQVSTTVILNLVRTHEGDKFDPATVAEDYQRIFGLKKFSDVQAKVEPTDKGVIVIFSVVEQKQIKRINFIGNVGINSSALSDAIDLKAGESIDQFRISLAKQALENLYHDKNFPEAHVAIDQDQLGRNGELSFNIVEGPNVRIRKITFPGAQTYTADRLKGQIKESTWIFILRPGTYDPGIAEDDVAALRRYYQSKGFFDVRVGRKLIWSADLRELQIDFVVDEGVRYIVDKVVFKGNVNVPAAEFRKRIKLVEGQPFDQDLVTRDVKEMVRAYSPFGFIYDDQSSDPAYLHITPQQIFGAEPGHLELIYDINEGRPFRLGQRDHQGKFAHAGQGRAARDACLSRPACTIPARSKMRSSGCGERLTSARSTSLPIGDDPATRDVLVEVEEAKTASFQRRRGYQQQRWVRRKFDVRAEEFRHPRRSRNRPATCAYGAGVHRRGAGFSREPGTRHGADQCQRSIHRTVHLRSAVQPDFGSVLPGSGARKL